MVCKWLMMNQVDLLNYIKKRDLMFMKKITNTMDVKKTI